MFYLLKNFIQLNKIKFYIQGDSGGPLLKLINNKWHLVGIVSNGDINCAGTGIYTRVSSYYDWILKNSV